MRTALSSLSLYEALPVPRLREVLVFLPHKNIHIALKRLILNRAEQGHDTQHLLDRLGATLGSYDAQRAMLEEILAAPLRSDWSWDEPDDLSAIEAACDPLRPRSPLPLRDGLDPAEGVRCAFLTRICGCVLGKPLEVNADLDQLQGLLEPSHQWPIRDYVSEAALDGFRERLGRGPHISWPETVRERIRWVPPDDDLSYTVLALGVLEQHGLGFGRGQLRQAWLDELPVTMTFGPERVGLAGAALETAFRAKANPALWRQLGGRADNHCGALIRVDAYGYAAAGHPALAAELAWRDAGLTHSRSGLYAAMLVAAAIAAAFTTSEPLEPLRIGLQFVPRTSRLHDAVSRVLASVEAAPDWLAGYRAVAELLGEYRHCAVFQELGLLANTLRHATDPGHGICLQVMQGADTDSFGATAGSLLGARFAPQRIASRWLEPFGDTIHVALARYYDPSLTRLVERMAALPEQGRSAC
jgi:ADP-ribosylglycohydrolase